MLISNKLHSFRNFTLQIYYLWQNSARIKTIIFVRESPKKE